MPSSSLLPASSAAAFYRYHRPFLFLQSASVPAAPSPISLFSPRRSRFLLLPFAPLRHAARFRRPQFALPLHSAVASLPAVEDLPSKLADIVKLFQLVPAPRAKYEQLLHYGKKLKPLPKEFQTLENKVQGCVSQKKTLELAMESEGTRVSDAARASSLSDGGSVEGKAEQYAAGGAESNNGGGAVVELGVMTRQQIIRQKLETALDPVVLEVEDVSYQHAGHAGVQRGASETHFNLKIVSPKFEGRTLVKRHRLVYDLLQEELQNGLHALSIVAKTPAEADRV